jgi:hypothetical protein
LRLRARVPPLRAAAVAEREFNALQKAYDLLWCAARASAAPCTHVRKRSL